MMVGKIMYNDNYGDGYGSSSNFKGPHYSTLKGKSYGAIGQTSLSVQLV